MPVSLRDMMNVAAFRDQIFTSSEYTGGAGPTASTIQSGGCSEETLTVAERDSSVRSLSLDVTSTVVTPCREARSNMVSARMYSSDSTYVSWPVSRLSR